MHTHYRTRGIFLRKEDRGEADQIFFVFTKDFGQIEILARGIRKITSKLRPAVEILCLSEIEFIQGKTYKTLTDALALEKFAVIKGDLRRLKAVYLIFQTANRLLFKPEKDERIWQLVNECLNLLSSDSMPVANCQIVSYYFIWNFLVFLGYAPELYSCVTCKRRILPGFFYFAPWEGGLICDNCALKYNQKEGMTLSENTTKILRIFLREPIGLLTRLKITKFELENLLTVSRFFLNSFHERKNEV